MHGCVCHTRCVPVTHCGLLRSRYAFIYRTTRTVPVHGSPSCTRLPVTVVTFVLRSVDRLHVCSLRFVGSAPFFTHTWFLCSTPLPTTLHLDYMVYAARTHARHAFYFTPFLPPARCLCGYHTRCGYFGSATHARMPLPTFWLLVHRAVTGCYTAVLRCHLRVTLPLHTAFVLTYTWLPFCRLRTTFCFSCTALPPYTTYRCRCHTVWFTRYGLPYHVYTFSSHLVLVTVLPGLRLRCLHGCYLPFFGWVIYPHVVTVARSLPHAYGLFTHTRFYVTGSFTVLPARLAVTLRATPALRLPLPRFTPCTVTARLRTAQFTHFLRRARARFQFTTPHTGYACVAVPAGFTPGCDYAAAPAVRYLDYRARWITAAALHTAVRLMPATRCRFYGLPARGSTTRCTPFVPYRLLFAVTVAVCNTCGSRYTHLLHARLRGSCHTFVAATPPLRCYAQVTFPYCGYTRFLVTTFTRLPAGCRSWFCHSCGCGLHARCAVGYAVGLHVCPVTLHGSHGYRSRLRSHRLLRYRLPFGLLHVLTRFVTRLHFVALPHARLPVYAWLGSFTCTVTHTTLFPAAPPAIRVLPVYAYGLPVRTHCRLLHTVCAYIWLHVVRSGSAVAGSARFVRSVVIRSTFGSFTLRLLRALRTAHDTRCLRSRLFWFAVTHATYAPVCTIACGCGWLHLPTRTHYLRARTTLPPFGSYLPVRTLPCRYFPAVLRCGSVVYPFHTPAVHTVAVLVGWLRLPTLPLFYWLPPHRCRLWRTRCTVACGLPRGSVPFLVPLYGWFTCRLLLLRTVACGYALWLPPHVTYRTPGLQFPVHTPPLPTVATPGYTQLVRGAAFTGSAVPVPARLPAVGYITVVRLRTTTCYTVYTGAVTGYGSGYITRLPLPVTACGLLPFALDYVAFTVTGSRSPTAVCYTAVGLLHTGLPLQFCLPHGWFHTVTHHHRFRLHGYRTFSRLVTTHWLLRVGSHRITLRLPTHVPRFYTLRLPHYLVTISPTFGWLRTHAFTFVRARLPFLVRCGSRILRRTVSHMPHGCTRTVAGSHTFAARAAVYALLRLPPYTGCRGSAVADFGSVLHTARCRAHAYVVLPVPAFTTYRRFWIGSRLLCGLRLPRTLHALRTYTHRSGYLLPRI